MHATLSEAKLDSGSVPAIGFFDVLEQIPDEQEFLAEVSRVLCPNGHIFLTVPAGRWLWSDDDVQAGHFRRYTCQSLRRAPVVAGFRPVYVSKMFSALPLPLYLLRTLPSLYGRRRLSPKSYQGLHKPKTRSLPDWVWRWEPSCVAGGRNIRIGTTCIALAARA